MNILICSVGTRNKIVQYFKKEFQGVGSVIATDMSELAPAIYDADRYYIVPSIYEEGYIEIILEICRKENIKAILSLIDPELSLLARNKDRFSQIGTTVIGSPFEICETCLNKWSMYQWLERHEYRCAKSYIDRESFYAAVSDGTARYPVIVKPICGSASAAVSKVFDQNTLEVLFAYCDDLMIQNYLDGQEIGVDAYIDMISHELVSVFAKRKIKMRAGETDKAVSFKDDKLFTLIEKFVCEFGLVGQVDIDLFDIGGLYYISEVNPRFGGGYPHAYACGCDHIKLIHNNLLGIKNQQIIGLYEEGVFMMKYNELLTKKVGG